MITALNIAVLIVVTAAAIAMIRVLRRSSLANRAVGLEALTPVLTCGMLIAAVISGEDRFIDLALVLGLLSFLTTVTVARYLESRDT